MGTYTPNLNLYKPAPTDNYEDFLPEFNNNMDKLDNSGGGSGGHTIVDPNGSDMPAEGKLQFTGNVNVTDDSVNGKTVVDIPASSGSGHTIIDQNGVSMTQRSGLQIIGANVTDDAVNNKTVVTVTGGGGINYSTTEQVIGTWYDNKPLYGKLIVYTPPSTISGTVTIESIASGKIMQVVGGTAYNSNDNRGYALPDVRTNGGTKITYDNGDVILEIMNDSWSSAWTFYVPIQYTKLTD